MLNLRKFAEITFYTILLSSAVYPLKTHAQVPNSIDDLPGDINQLKSWRCTKGEAVIEVEAKDVGAWQEMIEPQGWQCQETISTIPANDRQFSCEPDETIGIMTVTWLQGTGGRQQMQSWVNDLSQSKGMICTLRETTTQWE